jgi:hypothetical protein
LPEITGEIVDYPERYCPCSLFPYDVVEFMVVDVERERVKLFLLSYATGD